MYVAGVNQDLTPKIMYFQMYLWETPNDILMQKLNTGKDKLLTRHVCFLQSLFAINLPPTPYATDPLLPLIPPSGL